MKRLLIILFIGHVALIAQSTGDSLYKFSYSLQVPSTDSYQFMEYEHINWSDTGTSFSNYLDTVNYQVVVLSLDHKFKPGLLRSISFLDRDKREIKNYEFTNWPDSVTVNVTKRTGYIAFDNMLLQDTLLFNFYADQVPRKITLVSGIFNGLHRPLLKCKRRLTVEEIQDVYESIKRKKEAEVEKCEICYIGFEI